MNMAVFNLGFMWWVVRGGRGVTQVLDERARLMMRHGLPSRLLLRSFCVKDRLWSVALQMEVDRLCYFPLFEYSIDCLYINIWCVYKFIEFPQYIFLKALSSLDRDYIFLISLPRHQSFIQDATQEKKGGGGVETHSYSLLPAFGSCYYAVGGAWG